LIIIYLIVGVFFGLFASVVALFWGASLWLALCLYISVGSIAVVLLPAAQMVTGILFDRGKAAPSTDHCNQRKCLKLAKSSASQQGEPFEISMKILAVDDDPFIRELIPIVSAEAGFSEVIAVASGEQALKLLESSTFIFDCILLDINMPVMDGIELCGLVRQISQYRQTPIIMLTARRDIENMGDAYRAGATDYVAKPFEVEELGDRLRIVQEAIYAQRELSQVRQKATEYQSIRVPTDSFELPENLQFGGIENLVNHKALLNYVTQLPRKRVADIQMFAVMIDGIEAAHMQSSPQHFASLLQDVAIATSDCFNADQTLMAYTNNGILLIAVNSGNPMLANNIETDIEDMLQANISERDPDEGNKIRISVGGPVQPQSAKSERARMTAIRVITLAENRTLDKQGRQVAGLFKQ
jgi:DNA-binding response OmpR family regulator